MFVLFVSNVLAYEAQENAEALHEQSSGFDVFMPGDPLPSCQTAEELVRLVSENEGGTVTPTGNIQWDTYDALEVYTETTINMGPYSIFVDDAAFYAEGPLHFIGEGALAPLINVTGEWGWVDLYGVIFTATGDGGVALYMEDGNAFEGYNNKIEATGSGATAFVSDTDIDACMLRADAPGDGSVTVKAKGDATFFLCDVTGDTAVSAGGSIKLIRTNMSPMPANAAQLERKIFTDSSQYGECVELNETFEPYEALILDVYDPESGLCDEKFYVLPVTLDTSQYVEGTCGMYDISYAVQQGLLDFEFDISGTFRLTVYDPTLPFMKNALWYEDETETAYIQLAGDLSDAEDVKLLFSTDFGKSWNDAFEAYEVYACEGEIAITGLDTDTVYWFRLVVGGGSTAGTSNILKVWHHPYRDIGPDPEDNYQIAHADPPTDPKDDLMTFEELQEAVANSANGTATLTGNVIVAGNETLSATNQTTVEMGDYSIVVPGFGSHLYIDGSFDFKGNGDVSPLFAVRNLGQLIFRGESAVLATKKDATAVYGEGNIYVESAEIYAPKGTAVHAKGKAKLFYSYAEGEVAGVVSDTNTVELLSTIAVPEAEGAIITKQVAILANYYEIARYGICVEPGQDDFNKNRSFYFFEKSKPSIDHVTYMSPPLSWEAEGANDRLTPGEYV